MFVITHRATVMSAALLAMFTSAAAAQESPQVQSTTQRAIALRADRRGER